MSLYEVVEPPKWCREWLSSTAMLDLFRKEIFNALCGVVFGFTRLGIEKVKKTEPKKIQSVEVAENSNGRKFTTRDMTNSGY